jgi:hypothetical protein
MLMIALLDAHDVLIEFYALAILLSLQPEKMSGTLKEQLDAITPALREMRLRKEERMNQFRSVQGQIQKISAEIAGQSVYDDSITNVIVNENDLSLKKLEEYQIELQRLCDEKVKVPISQVISWKFILSCGKGTSLIFLFH